MIITLLINFIILINLEGINYNLYKNFSYFFVFCIVYNTYIIYNIHIYIIY